MKKNALVYLGIILLLLISACKKKKIVAPPTSGPEKVLNIAPCALKEDSYIFEKLLKGNSKRFVSSPFSIMFKSSKTGEIDTLEFAFNKYPKTGMYNMVAPSQLGKVDLENQISFWNDFHGFTYISAPWYETVVQPNVYIEHNENELIISYCELPDTLFRWSPQSLAYVGNGSPNKRYTMKY